MTLTEGTLLGGRVIYHQLRDGYRTGVEPVLLAACVPARPGERVLEAGTGAGAGLLCLHARVGCMAGLGVEIDPNVAEVARGNFAANGFSGLLVEEGDIEAFTGTEFDHAMVNPPWHAATGTPSSNTGRRRAKMASDGLLGRWVTALARTLMRRGTLSLILPANAVSAGGAALRAAECAEISLLPIWPRQGHPARLVVLRGIKGGRGGDKVLPGLVLHAPGQGYTPAAEAVLREGAALEFCPPAL